MKVRLSSSAKAYIAQEGRYLRKHSPMGAKNFKEIVLRAKKVVETFPNGGADGFRYSLDGRTAGEDRSTGENDGREACRLQNRERVRGPRLGKS